MSMNEKAWPDRPLYNDVICTIRRSNIHWVMLPYREAFYNDVQNWQCPFPLAPRWAYLWPLAFGWRSYDAACATEARRRSLEKKYSPSGLK